MQTESALTGRPTPASPALPQVAIPALLFAQQIANREAKQLFAIGNVFDASWPPRAATKAKAQIASAAKPQHPAHHLNCRAKVGEPKPDALIRPLGQDELAQRRFTIKVVGILEGLTSANFVAVADRLVGLINRSRDEDGCTLWIVAHMISLTAAKRDALAEHLARLCCRLAEQTSADISDVEVRTSQGVPVTGGRLFRHHLLDGCQYEFDLRLMAHGILAGRPKRAGTPQECGGSVERRGGVSGSGLDAYGSAAAQDTRRGRGIISFLAELFKMRILPTRMLAACAHALLSPTQDGSGVPERPGARPGVVCNMKGIEDTCTLLEALGAHLDADPVEGRALVDGCIADITRYALGRRLGAWRVRAMLGDLTALRERGWVPSPSQTASEGGEQQRKAGQPDFSNPAFGDMRGKGRKTVVTGAVPSASQHSWRTREPKISLGDAAGCGLKDSPFVTGSVGFAGRSRFRRARTLPVGVN